MLFLTGVAALDALAGVYWAAFVLLALLFLTLLPIGVRHVRDRRWNARVARWDRPEVWALLDAARDREARRLQSAEAWERLSVRVTAIATAFTDAVQTQVQPVLDSITHDFDARFRGFGDRMVAEERPDEREVRWL